MRGFGSLPSPVAQPGGPDRCLDKPRPCSDNDLMAAEEPRMKPNVYIETSVVSLVEKQNAQSARVVCYERRRLPDRDVA